MTGLGLFALAAPSIGAPENAYPAGKLPYRPYTLSPYDRGWIIEDAWPTIFYGEEVVPEIKRKCGKLAWARKAVDLMKREAELAMAKPPLLPVEPAGWRHDFYSRATAEHLLYEADHPSEYLDPSTGNYEHDDAERRAWVLLTHERTYRMMRSLGILYRLTGDERYAAWTIDGLRKAADYFTHDEFARGSALYYQPLYDAAVLAILANIYGLVRENKALTAGDHKAIRENIFEKWMPGQVAFLEKHPTHNMACYVSAALAYSGEALDRPEWTGLGLGEKTGMASQLHNGLRAGTDGRVDGFWYEGTMFYHFYSLCPLTTLWDTDTRRGGKLAKDPDLLHRFTEMFAAPAALVDRQLRLPAVGDLGAPRVMSLAAYRHLYEYAAGKLDFERFGPILKSIYDVSKAPRVDLEALAFGPDELVDTPPPFDTAPRPGLLRASGVPLSHTALAVAGTGVFRATAPHQLQVTFRCGHYNGGHDHPDRLAVLLTAFDQPISPDLGTAGYSLHAAAHNYFRTTLAHNTLSADEDNQTGDAVLEWRPDADPPRARGSIRGKDGVHYTRTVFFAPPYVVLLDEDDAPEEHRFGWVYHAYGDVKVTSPFVIDEQIVMLPLPDDKHFSMLTERKSGVTSGMLSATWNVPGGAKLQLLTASDGGFEVTSGKTPGQPWPDTQGCIVLRAPGTKRRFATVLEPYRGKPSSAKVATDGNGVIVHCSNGESRAYGWQ